MNTKKNCKVLSLIIVGILLFTGCHTTNKETLDSITLDNNKGGDNNTITNDAEDGEILKIWAFKDSEFIQSAIHIFQKEYSNCEIIVEFGWDFTLQSEIVSDNPGNRSNAFREIATYNDDIIRKLHTKLLGDDIPDILFLDGLSIETLNNKGFLSDIDIKLNESQYYTNILNSYSTGETVYAYPASFSVPIFAHDGSLSNIVQPNTIEAIASLYSDPAVIEGFSDEWGVFKTFFLPFYQQIFPNYKTIDEENLQFFLLQTKKIVDEIDYDKLLAFRFGDTSSSVSILNNFFESHSLFNSHKNVEILPLFEGNFINHNIVSIPKDASNKDQAAHFINIILSDKIQQMEQINFSVKKEVQIDFLKQIASENKNNNDSLHESSLIYQNNEDSSIDVITYDWAKLFDNYTEPLEDDYLMEGIIFEEALKYYRDEISIDSAVSECMNNINIILAERN